MSPSFAVAEMQFGQIPQRVQTNMKTGSEFQVAITAKIACSTRGTKFTQ